MLVKPSAHLIIGALGGYIATAEKLSERTGKPVKPHTVRSWFLQGIPQKFHLDFVKLAEKVGIKLSVEELEVTTELGKDRRRSLRRVPVTRKIRRASSDRQNP